jgi:hypothetical protein
MKNQTQVYFEQVAILETFYATLYLSWMDEHQA